MEYLTKPLTYDVVAKYIDLQTGRINVNIKLEFGKIACSSQDGTYEGLNDEVEELITGDYLYDIKYKPIGVEGDSVIFEVDADASDIIEQLADFLPGNVRNAAQNAVGNDEVNDQDIYGMLQDHSGQSIESMEKTLKPLEAEFDAKGCRGVQLADQIDALRVAIAVKRECPNWK